ncbi:MAG: ABC transporter permease subunit [Chitinophagales bacterium]|nr:ABC transporter permease subunit [Chitinophagales bacterium]
MRASWIIAKRELQSYFDSLIAYVMIIIFLGFTGFFTWLFGGGDIFMSKQASLQIFFGVSYWTLFFFIPAITMRQLAEERKTGTIELLLTKNVSDRQVVIGKFLATFILVCIALFCTLLNVYTIAKLGNLDTGATFGGYFALLLMSAAYISIGLYASSISKNQIVALLLSLMIGVFFHFLFGVIAGSLTGGLAEVFNYMNLYTHFESVSRGVIDTKDLVYFLSIIALGLLLAELSLSKRNIA